MRAPGDRVCVARLAEIDKAYDDGGARLEVLCRFSLEVWEGECVAVTGRSGSGKTTLLNIMGLLDADYSGEYALFDPRVGGLVDVRGLRDGARSRLRNAGLGFVFQSFNLIEYLTCLENICLAASFSPPPRPTREEGLALMARLGIAEKALAHPSQLSGGQKQRAAIARAMFLRPRLILCDEPTGALDEETSRGILALFREICERDATSFVIVTHDPQVASGCDRVIRMREIG